MSQVGEGGIESRSDCPLDTVLAFHHLGLIENVDAAERAVATDIAEQWVDQPIRHLPFVPCRLLPRNVVMQEQSRLVPSESGGEPTLELYPKPRVTQDSSNGGDRSVNAGVPDHECWVELPTVQQFGRGIAICDTAGDDATRVGSYVVDAQSAYRYCPTQEADLWQQCFLWWDAVGSAGVARACEEARHRPPRFASMRNRRPASLESLRHEAFPVGMHWPAQAPSKPKGKPRPHMRPPQPEAEEHAVERAERIRAGSIAIGELYLDGVYDGIVTPWLQLADKAAEALKEGRTPPAVPTRTIGQEQMRTWAQGVVWNCSDPLDCKLVTPSTRHTTFKGGKQIDRAAFRAVAAALDWHG